MTLHVGLFVMLSVVNLPLLRIFGAQQQDVLNDHPWKRIPMGYAIFFIQGNFFVVGFLGLEVETARQYYISRSWFSNRILSFQVINAQRALLVVYKQSYFVQGNNMDP